MAKCSSLAWVHYKFLGAPEDLVEAAACYCAPENLRLGVAGQQFVGSPLSPRLGNPAHQTMWRL